MVICSVCVSPGVRGPVDADLVRHLSLRKIAERHGLSIRSVRRHLQHLPQVLETETSTGPSIYIGQVTYNLNLVAPVSEEDEELSSRDDNPEEDQHEEGEHAGDLDLHDQGDPEEGLGHA